MAHTHDPGDTHEERQGAYLLEVRAEYTADEIDEMGKLGHAFKNADGSYSYPIGDEADLKNAIHAVGRGNSDHDAIRKYILGRAKDLGADDLIPSNWNSDGSLDDAESDAASDTTTCPRCSGDKTVDLGAGAITCPQCNGVGTVESSAPKIPATAIRGEMRGVPESRMSTGPKFELREVPNGVGGTNLRFTGFASVTGDDSTYDMEDWMGPWTESVGVSAFDKTLNDGADVAFLLNHTGMTLARTKPGTLKLSAEKDGNASPVFGVTGLHTEAMLDPQNMYVQAARSAVDRGDLDEMSFAFRVMRQEWNNEYTRRWINEVSLDKGDVSLVNYGANPITGGTVAMRQLFKSRADQGEPMPVERVLYVVRNMKLFSELRVGKTISSATESKLQEALDALHSTDDVDIPGIVKQLQAIDAALDAGQGAISDLLGVDDPDGDPKDLEPTLGPPPREAKALSFEDADREYSIAIRRLKGAA